MRNKLAIFFAVFFLIGLASNAWSETDTPFQIRYAANLNFGDSFVNITNTGANGQAPGGNICANVYVFAPDESMVSCCACPITPNGLVHLSARNDLISNTLTPGVPTSIVIKLLSTKGACNASTTDTATIVPGMLAWGTTLHKQTATTPNTSQFCHTYCTGAYPTYASFCAQNCKPTVTTTYMTSETPFSPATLSAGELATLATDCRFIQTNGAGYGICRSCQFGADAVVAQ